jgi:hypothetical protein
MSSRKKKGGKKEKIERKQIAGDENEVIKPPRLHVPDINRRCMYLVHSAPLNDIEK